MEDQNYRKSIKCDINYFCFNALLYVFYLFIKSPYIFIFSFIIQLINQLINEFLYYFILTVGIVSILVCNPDFTCSVYLETLNVFWDYLSIFKFWKQVLLFLCWLLSIYWQANEALFDYVNKLEFCFITIFYHCEQEASL